MTDRTPYQAGSTPGLCPGQSALPWQPSSPPRIGIDIGGVIIADGAADDEMFFSPDYLATPDVPGALEAIADLATWATCFIVSKVGTAKQQRCRRWLFAHQFPERCGIPPERWHFSTSRADKGLLAQQLHLDGFVDDHCDVLAAMPPTVRCRVLFGAHPATIEHAVHAPDWPTASDTLIRCLRDPSMIGKLTEAVGAKPGTDGRAPRVVESSPARPASRSPVKLTQRPFQHRSRTPEQRPPGAVAPGAPGVWVWGR